MVPLMGDRMAVLILLLILSFVLVSLPPIGVVKAEPKTIVVPDDYQTIQKAIDNATEGDTVFVKSGTYYNQTLVINKSLSLVGEDQKTTILRGRPDLIVGDRQFPYMLINLKANDITISGFTMKLH